MSREMAVNADRVDLTSSLTGRQYQLFVSIPDGPPPDGGWPVVYLIDGNLHFGIAVDTARIQACWPDVRNPIVVGIGYPTESVAEALKRRMPDLTTAPAAGYLETSWRASMPKERDGFGQMDAYLDFLEQQVKPLIVERYSASAADQTLMGHSLGGLTTLHALFRRPRSIRTYVSISPSIWWNDRAVLAYEPEFVRRARAGEVDVRVLVSAGEEEDPAFDRFEHGKGPMPLSVYREMAEDCSMVQNVLALVERLRPLSNDRFHIEALIHSGDDHNTVPAAGIARGMRFAMRRGIS